MGKIRHIIHKDNNLINKGIEWKPTKEKNKQYELWEENIQWYEIPTYKGKYLINEKTEIKSKYNNEKNIILKTVKNQYGKYKRILLSKNGKTKGYTEAQIMLWTMKGIKKKKGYEIHHMDRNPDNNRIENIVQMERKEHRKLHKKLNEYNKKLDIIINNNKTA